MEHCTATTPIGLEFITHSYKALLLSFPLFTTTKPLLIELLFFYAGSTTHLVAYAAQTTELQYFVLQPYPWESLQLGDCAWWCHVTKFGGDGCPIYAAII